MLWTAASVITWESYATSTVVNVRCSYEVRGAYLSIKLIIQITFRTYQQVYWTKDTEKEMRK